MAQLTDSENKVSKVLRNKLSTFIEKEPCLNDECEHISLTPYIFSEDMPKIMVVSMPLQLLINLKISYREIVNSMKKEFPNYIFLFRRHGDIPNPKVFTPIRIREEIIQDLVFPAVISARTNEVESCDEMTQVVYLDNKNQFWSKNELLSIEKLLCKVFEQNFRILPFGTEL